MNDKIKKGELALYIILGAIAICLLSAFAFEFEVTTVIIAITMTILFAWLGKILIDNKGSVLKTCLTRFVILLSVLLITFSFFIISFLSKMEFELLNFVLWGDQLFFITSIVLLGMAVLNPILSSNKFSIKGLIAICLLLLLAMFAVEFLLYFLVDKGILTCFLIFVICAGIFLASCVFEKLRLKE